MKVQGQTSSTWRKSIAEHSPARMQPFCLSLLLPAIDAKIAELIHSPQR